MKFTKLLNTTPLLIKEGKELAIRIASDKPQGGTEEIKSVIHQTIGNGNTYEYIGEGDRKIKLPIYFEDQDEYEIFVDFVKGGKPLLLACNFFPLNVSVNLDGPLITETYYKGWGMVNLKLTTATNLDQGDFSAINAGLLDRLSKLKETTGSKKTFLDKLKNFGEKSFNFTSNVNEKVGSVTNKVAQYSAAITNITQGLASTTTIITNPINSIQSSISQVIGGISEALTSVQNSVNAIRQIPGDVTSLIDSFLLLGDQLNDAFDLGDPNENVKYNTALLQSVGDGILLVDAPDNESSEQDAAEIEGSDFTDAEFFLTSVKANNKTMSVLLLSSILINLYENADALDKWNSVDLEKLRKTTDAIYEFIIKIDISNEFRLEIDLARNRFFKIYKDLYKEAFKTVEVDLIESALLPDVVFSINGNLDFYEETKQLNNVLGTYVIGKILVISND